VFIRGSKTSTPGVKIMEEAVILESVSAKLDTEGLLKVLRIEPGSGQEQDFRCLMEQAKEAADAGALYRPAFIEERGDDFIVADGVKLTSRVLAKNVEHAHRVFPFVATAGPKLEAWAEAIAEPVQKYLAEAIKGFVLISAINTLEAHIKDRYATGIVSRMNPGSLTDWPLTEQIGLFQIIGDTSTIGVTLKDDMFMTPKATVSGLWFASETRFESCMLCPMEQCPGRRAAFDKGLFANKYGKTG
jgi:hypothetical protein